MSRRDLPQPGSGNSSKTPALRTPLARQLLQRIFAYFFAVAVVVTAFQLALGYRRASQRLDGNIAALKNTFGPALADALWRFNDDGLRGIMTGMVNLPFVVGVEIRDQHDRRYMALGTVEGDDGRPTSIQPSDNKSLILKLESAHPLIARSFPLVHIDGSNSEPLGRLTAFSTRDILLEEIKGTFLIILVNSLVKTLALWAILFGVIHTSVGLPLRRLTAYLQQLDSDHLSAKPFTVADKTENEFRVLSHVLNHLVARLSRSLADNRRLVDELRQANATLQDRVSERTRDLEHLATTDVLTNLPNRRQLTAKLEEAWQQARLSQTPLSIVLADIDRFKRINDRFGHQAGDRVLQDFGAVLARTAEPMSIAGRWGGEEFLVICPRQTESDAATLSEKIRTAMADVSFDSIGAQTCSFGVAQQAPGETLQQLLARADAALYEAKRNGRNQVVRADSPLQSAPA